MVNPFTVVYDDNSISEDSHSIDSSLLRILIHFTEIKIVWEGLTPGPTRNCLNRVSLS